MVDLPLLQRKANFHMSVTRDLFGSEISSNGAIGPVKIGGDIRGGGGLGSGHIVADGTIGDVHLVRISSRDPAPPPLEAGSPYDFAKDRRYAGADIPATESLKTTLDRVLPYWDDAIAPRAVGDYVHAHLRGSVLRVIDASGHCPHMTHPEATIAALRAEAGGRFDPHLIDVLEQILHVWSEEPPEAASAASPSTRPT